MWLVLCRRHLLGRTPAPVVLLEVVGLLFRCCRGCIVTAILSLGCGCGGFQTVYGTGCIGSHATGGAVCGAVVLVFSLCRWGLLCRYATAKTFGI